jgi:hypothetical protein
VVLNLTSSSDRTVTIGEPNLSFPASLEFWQGSTLVAVEVPNLQPGWGMTAGFARRDCRVSDIEDGVHRKVTGIKPSRHG